MKRFAIVMFALLAVFPPVARGVEVTVKTAVPLRDSSYLNKVIGQVPAGAAFDALAVIPKWVLGTYRHNGVVLRGFIAEDAVLDQEKLTDLRERYRRRVAPGAKPPAQEPSARTIDETLALPDDKIDVGLGALLVGKQYDPSLDVPKYLSRVDAMAQELRARPEWRAQDTNPRKLIEILNDYIFTEGGYLAVAEDEAKPEHFLLHVLLDGKKGQCASLSTLYLALGERLGLPLFGVCAPAHIFVRYQSGGTKFNVEPTEEGARHWDITYAIGLGVPRTHAARSFYMRSLTRRQFLGILLSNLGVAYHGQGKLEEAVEALRKALSINPNDPEPWSNLGNAYAGQRKFDQAVEAHRKALSIHPNSAEAWNNLGVAYGSQGKFGEAVEAHRKALFINPQLVEGWTGLGAAYRSQGKLDEAVEAHGTALSINPNLAEAWTNLGVAYAHQRKLDQAVEAFRKALFINPNLVEGWTGLGGAYAEQGKFADAVEALRKALSINPNYANAWNNLAGTYYFRGEYASAWECVRKCEKAGGEENPELLRLLRREMREPGT